ncbi:hypothetical protein IEQ34_000602 [Dendrobium chrysotoxum]|uniref:Longin domain-containing protein n=1 Tax=Dendrobium chrysotoxum TaxID=161865 RepID=A0AAV7HAQ3_DENCH|nr:hypothetical protein IEQ34_000602 [Dendrobium chrysotoxum]
MALRLTSRYLVRRLSSSGKILSEEEKAAENVYIKGFKPGDQPGPESPAAADVKPAQSPPSSSTARISTDRNRNYAVLAGTITGLSALGCFVAKGTVVLAEHTSFSGNFSTIAIQCLQKLPPNNNKFTYSCDGHTFNFLVDKGFVFLVVADEAVGRSMPFVFLERIRDDFMRRYESSINADGSHPLIDEEDDDLFEDRFSIAYNLDREFGPKLKEHMQYCISNPEEISRLSKLKAQITEVKGIMMDNIEKVSISAFLFGGFAHKF